MKRVCVMLCFFALVLSIPVFAQQEPIHTISVSGQASVKAEPDEVQVTCTVTSTAIKFDKAIEDQAKKMSDLLAGLKTISIPKENVMTISYASEAEYNHDPKTGVQTSLKGYRVTQVLRVWHRTASSGPIIETLSKQGFVDSVRFVISDPRALQEQAVNLAIEDAKMRAEGRARMLGITLGDIVGFSEFSNDSQPSRYMVRSAGVANDAAAPQLPAGETEISASVTITYRLNVPK